VDGRWREVGPAELGWGGVCVWRGVGAGLQVPAGHPSLGDSWRNAEKRRAPGALALGERQRVLLGRPSLVFGTFTDPRPPPPPPCAVQLGSGQRLKLSSDRLVFFRLRAGLLRESPLGPLPP
jgi:hypothetical protein